jgi:hypothetical protein
LDGGGKLRQVRSDEVGKIRRHRNHPSGLELKAAGDQRTSNLERQERVASRDFQEVVEGRPGEGRI